MLVTHHLHEQLVSYAALRAARYAQRVRCVYQSRLFGTAHALQTVIDQAPDIVASNFILSATDYLVPCDFFPLLLNFHASHQGRLSISLKELPESELAKRSSVRFNADGSIAEIVEKPAAGTAPSSVGANLSFVLPPDIVQCVQDVPVSTRGEQEVQHAINDWIDNDGVAYGLIQPVPPEWVPPEQHLR